MPTITLTLSYEELNLIIKTLSKEPFKDVYELIGTINNQANVALTSIS